LKQLGIAKERICELEETMIRNYAIETQAKRQTTSH
jgi:hypothetical protein